MCCVVWVLCVHFMGLDLCSKLCCLGGSFFKASRATRPCASAYQSPLQQRLHQQRRLCQIVHASSSGGDTGEGSDSTGTATVTSEGQGPPLLTILAGTVVFLLMLAVPVLILKSLLSRFFG
eukprot:TRINITY_DN8903_c0_g1_i4.p1 TRINITY_DN8903_c0_g1~~TRINITY_DN8903_c0_g1_i4.p1  ORF type:complete len:121 (-),score=7.19 TRINITY_DN8903_c0_g1_i4:84-446(-)